MIPADLVVDATGRGSRTPYWLGTLGYPRPAVERIHVGVGYSSLRWRLRPGALGDDRMILVNWSPAHPRAAAVAAVGIPCGRSSVMSGRRAASRTRHPRP